MSGVSRRVMPGETVRGIPAVNNKDFQQTSIAGRRLPEMMKAFATMQRRVDALEAELERRAGAERNGAPEPAPPEIV
jgi:hypothetical protein